MYLCFWVCDYVSDKNNYIIIAVKDRTVGKTELLTAIREG